MSEIDHREDESTDESAAHYESCPACGYDLQERNDGDVQYIMRIGRQFARRENGVLRTYRGGEPVEPTEQELKNHADLFVQVDGQGRLLEDIHVDRPLSPEEEAAQKYREEFMGGREFSVTTSTDDADESGYSFTPADIENADYSKLRSMASRVDGVSGNQSASHIRDALRAKAETAGGNQ